MCQDNQDVSHLAVEKTNNGWKHVKRVQTSVFLTEVGKISGNALRLRRFFFYIQSG